MRSAVQAPTAGVGRTGIRLAAPDLARLRLWSGLVVLGYAATHLANHALGLVSLDAMEAGRRWFVAVWRAPPAEALLVASLLGHAGLSLWRVWERRSLRMSAGEAVQLVTGLLIPLWLTAHVLATGVMHRLTGVQDSYAYELGLIWPDAMPRMALMLGLVWLHGCVGLHRWLRLRAWYRRLRAPALALAVLLPVLALLGTVAGGRELAQRRTADPAWLEATARAEGWPTRDERKRLVDGPDAGIVAGFEWLVLGLFAARGLRWLVERRRTVRLTYPGGRSVAVPRGPLRARGEPGAGIPHASRLRRPRALLDLPRAGRRGAEHAAAALGRGAARAGPDRAAPDVRLACQIRPLADLVVAPLLPAEAGPGEVLLGMDPRGGAEREMAMLFADLRGFTHLRAAAALRHRLRAQPVFRGDGQAIERAGGRVDKFVGDGIMALFGLAGGPLRQRAPRAARRAAMGEALDAAQPRPGRGAWPSRCAWASACTSGPVIVGEMGYGGRAASLTAIGDTVNIASRLEALTKDLGVQLVVSERLARRAGGGLDAFPLHETDLRGRSGRIVVRLVAELGTLPEPPGMPAERAGRWWRRVLLPLASG